MKLDENQVSSILEHTANWEEQNRVAIDYYNKRVKKEGLFSDHFRIFWWLNLMFIKIKMRWQNRISHILSTQEISTISIENLGDKVCSLKDEREEIIKSIDFLITGF